MELLDRACPHCGGGGFVRREALSRDHWSVGHCADCGFVFLKNPPPAEALVEAYAWEKTRRTEKIRRRREAALRDVDRATRWRMRLFRSSEAELFKKIFGHGHVLDIGCGGGARLPEPLVPFGIEISRALCEQADETMRARGGYAVHAPAVEGLEAFEDGFFRGVLARSYLEHETEPLRILTEAHRVLEPGGLVYVRVPNFGSVNRRLTGREWCGLRYPDHVNYFDVASLRRMARAAGFTVRLRNPLNILLDDNIKACLVKA